MQSRIDSEHVWGKVYAVYRLNFKLGKNQEPPTCTTTVVHFHSAFPNGALFGNLTRAISSH